MSKILFQCFTFPGELTDLNTYINAERANRFQAAKIKKAETARVAEECKTQGFFPIDRMSHILFRWYSRDARKDMDNVEGAQKFIWDGLKLAGVIPNDSRRHTPIARAHNHFIDADNPRIEIVFEGASDR